MRVRVAALAASSFVIATVPSPELSHRDQPHAVAADSIYALAVDPNSYPNDAVAYLLDEGVYTYQKDGTGTETVHQVVQILREEAVKDMGEFSFRYSPGHEKWTLNWMKVVKPNGDVIADKPAQIQDADVPAALANPVYVDDKIKRITLGGVAAGTIIDYSFTREEVKPYLPGNIFISWRISTGAPTRRSRLIVDLPSDVTPKIRERALTFKRDQKTANGRTMYAWVMKDVPVIRSEPLAADSDDVRMRVDIGSPFAWNDVSTWYAGLAKDRYALNTLMKDKVRKVVADARTHDDTIRAVQRWVAQDIRYVSVSLGIAGYQPRMPDQVVETGFGDCKDKATLFVAAMQDLGMKAFPVLLNSFGRAERDLPAIQQFDHAIAAVPKADGSYQFVDLTAEFTPYGRIPIPEEGGFAIVVHPDGRGEEVRLPREVDAENRTQARIIGTLSTSGTFDGHVEVTASGGREDGLRYLFGTPLDSIKRANLLRSMSSGYFTGATASNLQAFNGKDLSAVAKITYDLKGGKATQKTGDMDLLTIPVPSGKVWGQRADNLAQRPKRVFPIDAAAVAPDGTSSVVFELTLPPKWKARFPKNVAATSAFGSYKVTYAQDGDVLRVTYELTGARGVYPKEKINDLIDWLKKVGEDDSRVILLEKP